MNQERTTNDNNRSCQSFPKLANSLLQSILSKKTSERQTMAARRKLLELSTAKNENESGRSTSDLSEGAAGVLGLTDGTEQSHAHLRLLDTTAREMVTGRGFNPQTFAEVGRYLLLRYTGEHTTPEDRLNVRSTLILNLFMLESCLLDTKRTAAKRMKILRDPVIELDTDELSIFNPNHRLPLTLTVLKHYFLLNLRAQKVCTLFKAMTEALEPSLAEIAPENRTLIASAIVELQQSRTWPRGHMASEVILSLVPPDALAHFDCQTKDGSVYTSLGRQYLVTKEKFFLPLW